MGAWRPCVRAAVYERDNRRCVYCEAPVFVWQARFAADDAPADAATIDHVVPVVDGGGHGYPNVVTACHACNSAKQDRTVRAFLEGRHGVGEVAETHIRRVRLTRKRRFNAIVKRLRFERAVEEEIKRRIDAGTLARVDEGHNPEDDGDPPF